MHRRERAAIQKIAQPTTSHVWEWERKWSEVVGKCLMSGTGTKLHVHRKRGT